MQNSRAAYLIENGGPTQKLNVFFTTSEWERLVALADDSNMPIGNFIMRLAAEHERRIKSLGSFNH